MRAGGRGRPSPASRPRRPPGPGALDSRGARGRVPESRAPPASAGRSPRAGPQRRRLGLGSRLGAVGASSSSPVSAWVPSRPGQIRDGGRLEDLPQRHLEPEPVAQPATSRAASSEWPPRSKKSSSTPTRGSPSISAQISARAASSGVRGATWAGAPIASAGPGGGRASAIQLSIGGQGQRRRRHERGGHEVSGQALARVLAQRAAVQGGHSARDDIGGEPLIARRGSHGTTATSRTAGCSAARARPRRARCESRAP